VATPLKRWRHSLQERAKTRRHGRTALHNAQTEARRNSAVCTHSQLCQPLGRAMRESKRHSHPSSRQHHSFQESRERMIGRPNTWETRLERLDMPRSTHGRSQVERQSTALIFVQRLIKIREAGSDLRVPQRLVMVSSTRYTPTPLWMNYEIKK